MKSHWDLLNPTKFHEVPLDSWHLEERKLPKSSKFGITSTPKVVGTSKPSHLRKRRGPLDLVKMGKIHWDSLWSNDRNMEKQHLFGE